MRARLALGAALAAAAACGGEKAKPADDGLLINQQSSEPLPSLNPDPAQNTFAPALGVDLTKFRKTPSAAGTTMVRTPPTRIPGTASVHASITGVSPGVTGYGSFPSLESNTLPLAR